MRIRTFKRTSQNREAYMVVDQSEASLVYHALREYADSLQRSVESAWQEAGDAQFEDLAFLHETLGKVYRFLFDLLENYTDPEYKRLVRNFLDAI